MSTCMGYGIKSKLRKGRKKGHTEMGLSASQGRMLGLTARLSDLEYRSQDISNQKLRLSSRSEAVSKNYLEALDAKKLTAYNAKTSTNIDASLASLYSLNQEAANGKKRVIVDASGNVVVSADYYKNIKAGTITSQAPDNYDLKATATKTDKTEDDYALASNEAYSVIERTKANSTEYLYDQLSKGNWFIKEYNDEGGTDATGAWEEISWS